MPFKSKKQALFSKPKVLKFVRKKRIIKKLPTKVKRPHG